MTRLSLLALALTLAACEADPAADVAPVDPAPQAADVAPVDPAPQAVGEAATATSTVLVDYEGRLEDGSVFDSGDRVEFRLPELIPGVSDGIVGMRAGDTKTFTVAPEDGYGPDGVPGVIPPGEDITFDVTVHEVR